MRVARSLLFLGGSPHSWHRPNSRSASQAMKNPTREREALKVAESGHPPPAMANVRPSLDDATPFWLRFRTFQASPMDLPAAAVAG